MSSLETNENSIRTLQYQTWSIFSWNSPKGTPGGRMKTQSWWLVFLNFLDANGQQSTRCSPSNVLCPMRSVEYSLRWPSDDMELISSRVSRSLRIWNNAYNAFYVNYAIYAFYAIYAIYALQESKLIPGRVWVVHARRFGSYFQAVPVDPGWHKNENGTQTSIDPACQGAQTVFCTLHTFHICHAELIPMQLHDSLSYAHHLLPEAARRWFKRLRFLARSQILHRMPAQSTSFSSSCRNQRSALNGSDCPVWGLNVIQSSPSYPWSASSIRAVKHKKHYDIMTITHFM